MQDGTRGTEAGHDCEAAAGLWPGGGTKRWESDLCVIISVARRAAPDRKHSIIRGQIH